jgi:hypothetical protein
VTLWLVRVNGDPVALVSAKDRAAAESSVRARIGDAAGAWTTISVGRDVAYVDLRTRSSAVAVVTPPATRRKTATTSSPPPHREPDPHGVAAFAAACAANGADPEVARRSRFYQFSAIRHAVWYAMACAGFDGRACARVTGHHGATVGKVVLGLLACVRTDDAFATAHAAAVESLQASATSAVC